MEYKIFVGQRPDGEYTKKMITLLESCERWMESKNATVDMVKEEIAKMEAIRKAQGFPYYYSSNDMQGADIWDEAHVKKWEKYIPEIKWFEVTLTAR